MAKRRRRTMGAAKKKSGAGCKIEKWRGMGKVRVCRKRNGAMKSWKKVSSR